MKKKFLYLVLFSVVCYQCYLFITNDGNFRVHVEYYSFADAQQKVDFSIKLNGEKILSDTFGINHTITLDSVYLLPFGINDLEYSSESMRYYNKKKIINLFFLSNHIELNDEPLLKNNQTDSIRTFPVLYFYLSSDVGFI